MADNQPQSETGGLETPATNQAAISSQKEDESRALDFSRLTHQNWLFINAFLASGNVKRAYQLAKYTGSDESAPYQIFKKLKVYIEQLGDLDVTSRARLQADLKGVLELPLEERKSLNLKEWLEVRKFVAKITPEAIQSKPQISMLVINRPASKPETVAEQKGDTLKPITPPIDSAKIIDAELIDPQP